MSALRGASRLQWRPPVGLPRHGAEVCVLPAATLLEPCHEQASQSPKMELDTSFAMLAPELSRLQVDDSDMELED